VRVNDILGLASSSLWRQKVRTMLTLSGVVFGSFVLVTPQRFLEKSPRLSHAAPRGERAGERRDVQNQAGADSQGPP
jgi:hypothetical protein